MVTKRIRKKPGTPVVPKISKKDAKDKAREAVELTGRVMRVNEVLWMAEWDSKPNPFLAFKWCVSPEHMSVRKPIIDAWLEARDHYYELCK